ncbi:MAG: hypothetical protein ACRDPS_10935 [Nocardioides sp.]|uniref:hypothetical protein n=1 Tax=Nocardioides sp. TaxID=35761 RepID=UPI003D6AD2F3
MRTPIATDEVESTRTERFLAVALTAFLLVGTVWFYVKVEDWWQLYSRTGDCRGSLESCKIPGNEAIQIGVRIGFVLVLCLLGFWTLYRLRRSGSRFLPLGFAFAATGVIMVLVFALDYTFEYADFGPLVLSLLGAAATVAVFIAVQRLLAKRIPAMRVRKGDCPYCGYPVRGKHCEGCGRETIAPCSTCEADRRVGSLHCVACGAD